MWKDEEREKRYKRQWARENREKENARNRRWYHSLPKGACIDCGSLIKSTSTRCSYCQAARHPRQADGKFLKGYRE